ncbi:helix-turn-helix domain-containing protein [Salipaludibacillus agaradhaerens]|jgi:XRE family transcriptional regulator of biofilm formation|uniref:Helix-turn-helix domain-containing protein n=1 Tax=Salipaludibacillus agaradhaerens TaxID=76935 RepID=A0A9Q4B238_SALAG|nr:helix-turn-helix domain-containing protein [Salipaludibacillus agaradhaerens]UJW57496.1 helix-turn-helix domain-containing protein [Bacillus sp. A116_S68]MCR6096740.1 helix-turn-helix domain-containing protein [Salipaludibacillus agaradhaerens]MCR6106357.1 helix-turn-helix domain-containing protein [Salipaludibacillus agaradhaerens]MCR6113701.1 helix-turn-helix domain-containing protein [Salipaludibacillus agaradhaerens]MCR6118390.1 helix-turn-helix domain-containing protein [Salipaludibaci
MIGERVKKYRKESGMSLTELAEKAGVAKSYLSAIERNIQTNPSIQFLEKIANVLNIKMDLLLHDDVTDDKQMDAEWQSLVKEAMESGVSKDEFKEFLEFNKWKIQQK